MTKIKTYNQFITEKFSLKKVVAGAAIATTLLGCGVPSDTTQGNTVTQSSTSAASIPLPNNFKMKQVVITVGTDMNIVDNDDNKIGKVEERTINLGTTFEYFDNTGAKKATAKKEVLNLVTTIDISDENGNKIGQVKEEVIKSLFSIKSHYSISDASGDIIGESEKSDWLSTSVEILSPSGDIICEMDRDMINIVRDTWSVKIIKQGYDNRLFVFIPCYKTSADKSERRINNYLS